MSHTVRVVYWCVMIVIAVACQASRQSPEEPKPIPPPTKQSVEVSAPVAATDTLFDDFSYTDQQSMLNHGWIIRTEPGWPGVLNAVWARNSVSLWMMPISPAIAYCA